MRKPGTKLRPLRINKQRGFTLIELMVVVVIIGILAALVVPKLISRTDDARVMAARSDIATLMAALKLYKLDNQRFPSTEQGLQALVAKPTSGPVADGWKAGGYIDKLPKDPWGNPYQYLSPGIKGEIDVFSLGADGQPGGEGNDADIGSWDLAISQRVFENGFTLLELLLVMVIAAMTIGLVSMDIMQSNSQALQKETQSIALLLQLGREEAILRNRPVAFE
eukprot:gene27026-29764_t